MAAGNRMCSSAAVQTLKAQSPELRTHIDSELERNVNASSAPLLNLSLASSAIPPAVSQQMKTNSPVTPELGGFRRVCRTEDAGPCPFPGLEAGVLQMRVKEGSKIRNLMGFAMARVQGEGAARQVVFAGSGRAVTKTITCAEIMKRKVPGLHQLTKLHYTALQEVWESQEGPASEMTVHRTVPSISILLSKDPLDPCEPGYQPPADPSAPWETPGRKEEEEEEEEEEEGSGLPLTASKRPYCPATHTSQAASKRVCLMDRSHQC
ncbi:ribonuclease P protein subunit p25-like protein [Conger conger]|uniref:ribonuclease P protein subunit p25-like protein n=1 Tax=Conger conger TaxID=82655 RepID=UPI002A5A1658|nr:ribonuclease P protein subunit p25-like protein [Conger conger]